MFIVIWGRGAKSTDFTYELHMVATDVGRYLCKLAYGSCVKEAMNAVDIGINKKE